MITANRLKYLKKLNQKKYRILEDSIIVEGKRLVEQLVKDNIDIVELFYTDDYSPFPLINPSFKITTGQMQAITATVNCQNVAALVKPPKHKITNNLFLLYLDDIKDPGNLGTIFRTAASSGVTGIILSENCCEVFNPKVVRSSMGSVFNIPFEINELSSFKNNEIEVLASSLQNSLSIFDFVPCKKNTILVIGSEAFGVSAQNIELADKIVKIPQVGSMESLNAAVASGILIFNIAHTKNIL